MKKEICLKYYKTGSEVYTLLRHTDIFRSNRVALRAANLFYEQYLFYEEEIHFIKYFLCHLFDFIDELKIDLFDWVELS